MDLRRLTENLPQVGHDYRFFGIIFELESKAATIAFIAAVLILAFVQSTVNFIGQYAKTTGNKDLFEKLKSEMTTLGIMSFGLFVIGQISSDQNWKEAYAFVHIILLFIAAITIAQTIFLTRLATHEHKKLSTWINLNLKQLCEDYDYIADNKFASFIFHWLPFWLHVPSLRQEMEYKVIDRYFTVTHQLPENFPFANYMGRVFRQHLMNTGLYSSAIWGGLAILIAINVAKIHIIDSTFEAPICYNDPSAKYKGTLLTCYQYILEYAFVLVNFLSMYILLLLKASCTYYIRILKRAMREEGAPTDRSGYRIVLGLWAQEEKSKEQPRSSSTTYRRGSSDAAAAGGGGGGGGGGKPGKGGGGSKVEGGKGEIIGKIGSRRFLSLSDPVDDEGLCRENDDDVNAVNRDMDRYDVSAEDEPEDKLLLSDMASVLAQGGGRKRATLTLRELNRIKEDEEQQIDEEWRFAHPILLRRPIIVIYNYLLRQQGTALFELFLANSPAIYFAAVELAVLLQNLYIAMWASNLAYFARDSDYKISWELAMIIWMAFNQIILRRVLLISCHVKALYKLDEDIADQVVEDVNAEETAFDHLATTLYAELRKSNVPVRRWRKFVSDIFTDIDRRSTGTLTRTQFRSFLIECGVYFSKGKVDFLFSHLQTQQQQQQLQGRNRHMQGRVLYKDLLAILFPELRQTQQKKQEEEEEEGVDERNSRRMRGKQQQEKEGEEEEDQDDQQHQYQRGQNKNKDQDKYGSNSYNNNSNNNSVSALSGSVRASMATL